MVGCDVAVLKVTTTVSPTESLPAVASRSSMSSATAEEIVGPAGSEPNEPPALTFGQTVGLE